MAGTIFGLGLSQQIDANGQPMAGCLLYIYDANTTTPATTYQDFGLTSGLELPFPIEADANGRIPQFWMADGSYRARLTDSSGVVQFDLPEVLALGASSGTVTGGGVDANSIFQTGDTMFLPVSGTRAGFVRYNGRTIGSATSGATERANADCQALFEYLWAKYSDTLCPVSTGRGATAAADWGANKTIGTLDCRGRGPIGLDDMGNSAAGRLDNVVFDVGNGTTGGSMGGEALHTLVIDELAAHAHDASSSSDGAHTHTVASWVSTNSGGAGSSNQLGTGTTATTSSNGTHSHTITIDSRGGDGAHNNMHPFVLGTWYAKL